jgi:hypothetical protein
MSHQLPVRQFRQYLVQDAPMWMRIILGIGLLLINVAVAVFASQGQLTVILYVLIGISLLFSFMSWPAVGLIFAALSGSFVSIIGPSGLNVTMILVALLLCLWLFGMVVRPGRIQFKPSSTSWSLIAFVAVSLFSFGIGQLPWYTFAQHAPLGAQLGGLSIVILSVGTFLLAANQLRDIVWLKRITWAFLALSAIYVVANMVLPNLGFHTSEILQQVGSVFYIWLVAIAFSQALYNRELHPGWRIALIGMVVVNIYFHLFLRYEIKSSWFPMIVCMAVIIGSRSWRAGLGTVIVCGLILFYLSTNAVSSEEYSISTRLEAWAIILKIIKISPIWGLGFANYYWYTPLFPIRGYEVSFNSHNNYLDITAQVGLVGLLCILVFFWQIGRLAWRLRGSAPPGFAQAYVYGALGGLSGMVVTGMLGDWILPFFYNVGLLGFRSSMLGWLFLGGLVSLEHIVKSSKPG